MSFVAVRRVLAFIIVDDQPLFRGALRQALLAGFQTIEVGEAGSMEELAVELERGHEVDLVLLDLAMPGVRGFSGLLYLRAQYPDSPVVIVWATEDDKTIGRCIGLGASGYIPKSLRVEQIRQAVAEIIRGEVWTPPDFRPGEPGAGCQRMQMSDLDH